MVVDLLDLIHESLVTVAAKVPDMHKFMLKLTPSMAHIKESFQNLLTTHNKTSDRETDASKNRELNREM